jgi:glycosyltransferase involved in cell wall biosynthesis
MPACSNVSIVRILHCIPHLTGGGAERQLAYLAEHSARAGHEVHIAYLTGGPAPTGLELAGVRLHPLAHKGTHDPLLVARLIRLVRRLRPDLVQTWLLQMDVLAGLAAFATHTPWVLREAISGAFWTKSVKSQLRRWVAMTADAVVSNSTGGDAYWQSQKPHHRRFVIGNAVAIEAVRAASPMSPTELGLSPDRPIIVSAGRLDEQKNLDVLIRALARVVAERPAYAVIFGEGPLRAPLEALIDRIGANGRILMPGFSTRLWSALKCAQVFVSISRYEGRPNVVLEAMACGLPLVVSDIPAHREILDAETALLVGHYEDPQAVADAVIAALSDRNSAAQRSERALARVLDAGVPRMAEAYERVYTTILQRRSQAM